MSRNGQPIYAEGEIIRQNVDTDAHIRWRGDQSSRRYQKISSYKITNEVH